MKCPFLLIWAPLSVVIGWAALAIPWGSATGLHGRGLPIPGVLWDKPRGSDHFLDYLNPLAYFENPLVIFVLGLMVWGIYHGIRFLVFHSAEHGTQANSASLRR